MATSVASQALLLLSYLRHMPKIKELEGDRVTTSAIMDRVLRGDIPLFRELLQHFAPFVGHHDVLVEGLMDVGRPGHPFGGSDELTDEIAPEILDRLSQFLKGKTGKARLRGRDKLADLVRGSSSDSDYHRGL